MKGFMSGARRPAMRTPTHTFLGGRMLLSLIKPTLQIFQHVHALRDHLVIHRVLPFVWSVREVLELRTKIPPASLPNKQPKQNLLTAAQTRQASSVLWTSYSG